MLSVKFDIATIGTAISGEAGKQIKIYQIHMSNNHVNPNKIRLLSLDPTKDYYGGNQGAVYIRKKGQFQLIYREAHKIPYFVIDAGEDFIIDSDGQISGEILYEIE